MYLALKIFQGFSYLICLFALAYTKTPVVFCHSPSVIEGLYDSFTSCLKDLMEQRFVVLAMVGSLSRTNKFLHHTFRDAGFCHLNDVRSQRFPVLFVMLELFGPFVLWSYNMRKGVEAILR